MKQNILQLHNFKAYTPQNLYKISFRVNSLYIKDEKLHPVGNCMLLVRF